MGGFRHRFPQGVVEGLSLRTNVYGEAMGDDAIFRIYSMTKPFTSVAALILMEEGALQLVDPVAKYVPEFAEMEVVAGDDTEPAKRSMTVQDLLRHTSGLTYGEITPNEAVREGYAAAGAYNPDVLPYDSRHVDPEEQVAGVAATPLLHQPGTVFEQLLHRQPRPASRGRFGPAARRLSR
jgi:CubicO group peptidase (beta-lactamase class C family)